MGKTIIKTNSEKRVKLTRRQFLKDAGLIIGGAALTQTAFAAACGSPGATTTNAGTPTAPAITTPGTTPTPATTAGVTTTPAGTITTVPGDVYVPPAERPPLKETPGCTTFVAFDRSYSIEHIWVKELENNRVVLGMTDKMQALMGGAWRLITLPLVGDTYPANGSFGEIEGFKMTVVLINPVTIRVIQVNRDLLSEMSLLNTDPYVRGWMIYGELVNPDEIKTLISAEEYMMLQAK
jgi:glycine cleavage system H protein